MILPWLGALVGTFLFNLDRYFCKTFRFTKIE